MANLISINQQNDLTKLILKLEQLDKLERNERKDKVDEDIEMQPAMLREQLLKGDFSQGRTLLVTVELLANRIFGENSNFAYRLKLTIRNAYQLDPSPFAEFAVRCRNIQKVEAFHDAQSTSGKIEALVKLGKIQKDNALLGDEISLHLSKGNFEEALKLVEEMSDNEVYTRLGMSTKSDPLGEIAQKYAENGNFVAAAEIIFRIPDMNSMQNQIGNLYKAYAKKFGHQPEVMMKLLQEIIQHVNHNDRIKEIGIIWMLFPGNLHWLTPQGFSRVVYSSKANLDKILSEYKVSHIQALTKAADARKQAAIKNLKETRMKSVGELTKLILDITKVILSGYDEPTANEIFDECLRLEAEELQKQAK